MKKQFKVDTTSPQRPINKAAQPQAEPQKETKEEMLKRLEMEAATNETQAAPANNNVTANADINAADAKPETKTNAQFNSKKLAIIMANICLLVVTIVITSVVTILYQQNVAKEKVYKQYAEEWNRIYNNPEHYAIHGITVIGGKYVMLTDLDNPNVELTEAPISNKEPLWVEEGLQECLEGKQTEKAYFAARFHEIENTCEHKEDLIALGIGRYENSNRFNTTQYEMNEKMMVWVMAGTPLF